VSDGSFFPGDMIVYHVSEEDPELLLVIAVDRDKIWVLRRGPIAIETWEEGRSIWYNVVSHASPSTARYAKRIRRSYGLC